MSLPDLINRIDSADEKERVSSFFVLLNNHFFEIPPQIATGIDERFEESIRFFHRAARNAVSASDISNAVNKLDFFGRHQIAFGLYHGDFQHFAHGQLALALSAQFSGDHRNFTRRKAFIAKLDSPVDFSLLDADAPSPTGDRMADYFGQRAYAQGKRIDDFSDSIIDVLAVFIDCSTEDLSRWINLMIDSISREVELNSGRPPYNLPLVEKTMMTNLFEKSNPAMFDDYLDRLSTWFRLLSYFPAAALTRLSDLGQFHALTTFARSDLNPEVDWPMAVDKLELLEKIALRLNKPITAARAAVKTVKWAIEVGDDSALSLAKRTMISTFNIYSDGHPEVASEAIWAIRTCAELHSAVDAKKTAVDLLLKIPNLFPFDSLNTNARRNYADSRVTLAQLFYEAHDTATQRALLREAAECYRKADADDMATALLEAYKLI